MPYMKVELWAGRTKAEKAAMAQALTDAMVKTLKIPPEALYIVIEDVPKENWAVGGKLCG